ncbi:MAG TPA: hypothetical protein VIS74_01720, partial [Chthoniobacterales bacterium]
MSDPEFISPSESLDQLAPGVVLGGRYSLKSRVPRWIADRRFKARDLESGETVAVLVWPEETPWFGELVRRLEALPEPIHRYAGSLQGYGVVILNWRNGLRAPKGSADSAEEVLRLLRNSVPARRKRAPLPPRREFEPEPASPANPVVLRNPWTEWIGFGLAVVVALAVIGFTFQLGQALRKPVVIDPGLAGLAPKSAPAPVSLDGRLKEAETLRKNGNATAALGLLLELDANQPGNARITQPINSLLDSLDAELPAMKLGL